MSDLGSFSGALGQPLDPFACPLVSRCIFFHFVESWTSIIERMGLKPAACMQIRPPGTHVQSLTINPHISRKRNNSQTGPRGGAADEHPGWNETFVTFFNLLDMYRRHGGIVEEVVAFNDIIDKTAREPTSWCQLFCRELRARRYHFAVFHLDLKEFIEASRPRSLNLTICVGSLTSN